MEPLKVNSDTPELLALVAHATSLYQEYMKRHTFRGSSQITFESGRRYIKLLHADSSVYCFVDRTNGDILKAATYKAPAPNGKRGNIFVKGWENCIDWHGTKYLR